MRVADLIRDSTRHIADEWAVQARKQVPADEGIPPLVLLDHIPDLLTQLAAWLELHDEADARRFWDMAHKHAMDRLDLNFQLREVVHEYRVLRRVLFNFIRSAQGGPEHLEDLARLDEAIDAAVAEAVDRFSREREKQRLAEAEQTAEFRERFIGIVSHDLRNPLNAIMVCSSLVQRSEGLPPSAGVQVERIRVNAERMTRMISNLLDLTRGRLGGGIPIAAQSVDLAAVARSVVDTIEAAYPGRVIAMDFQGDLNGQWDPDRLSQVLGNLLTNALQHGDADAPVRLELRDTGDLVEVGVHNTGPPIDPEDLPHVFDAFRRSQKNGSTDEGLGLGLYISSEIVHAHGGRIEITSTADQGTTVTLKLPRWRSPRW